MLIWSNAMASIRKPFLFAAIGLTLIVTAGMGVYFAQDLLPGNLQAMLNGTRPKQHDSKKKETKKEIVAELEPFAVNLAGPGLSRYLRLVLRVSLQEEEDKQRIKEAATQIRDSLLMLLTSKRADELLTVEGKTQLRGEVVGEINKAAGKELVKAVYFKDFLIQ
ncbi:MAG: flagellar basal body-associated FliL family protein [Deltaproteobacteria bacterium]|nr:flagellar basal body-associated FliL family protein [Deltaproteobacteria bacterium]